MICSYYGSDYGDTKKPSVTKYPPGLSQQREPVSRGFGKYSQETKVGMSEIYFFPDIR